MPLSEGDFGLLPVRAVADPLLETFVCGKPHLEAFLRDSKSIDEQRLGRTTVVFHKDYPGAIVGYFTLANDSIPLKTSEQTEFGLDHALSAYPAVKLGRFAVNSALQGQGVGRQIIALVHGVVLDLKTSAARLVILDADATDIRVPEFYRKCGYVESLWAEAQAKSKGKGEAVSTVKMIRDVMAA